MKVAYCVVKNIARGGGIEKYTNELGSRLVTRGHEVCVYSMNQYGDVPHELNGMKIIGVPSVPWAATEKLSAGFFGALRTLVDSKVDIVHFHSVAAGAFARISRLRGPRCVLQMHGIEWERTRWNAFGSRVLKILERTSIEQSHALTAVSKKQCNFYRELYDVDMRYIPPGAVIKPSVEAQKILEWGLKPRCYFLFASRLVREKGAHHIVSSFRKLDTDFKLVIAGDAKGEENYKAELMKLAGGDARIVFPGYVEGRVLEELFSNAFAFVHPSELEGLSIALLEGMSYGNCCVVSDIPENLESLGDTGVSFRNADVDDLATKIRQIMKNPEWAANLGHKARERVRTEYSWDHIADEFESFYSEQLAC